jgi:DnaK suppressor protein
MNTEVYRQRLLEERERLTDQMSRVESDAKEAPDMHSGDAADRSIAGEQREDDLTTASRDSALLEEVEAALARIADGSYGRCLADGGPIEEKRLQAVPWAQYCIRHQNEREAANPPHTPTL